MQETHANGEDKRLGDLRLSNDRMRWRFQLNQNIERHNAQLAMLACDMQGLAGFVSVE